MLRAARLSLVLVVLVAIQTTWLADWRPFGATGDLLLLLTIGTGIAAGAHRGAVVGFAAGVLMDLVLLTPFGLSSLTYLAIGFAVGSANEGVLRAAAWIPPAATFLATSAGMVLYVILGQLVGQQFRIPDLARIVVVTSVLHTALSPGAVRVAHWIDQAGFEGARRPLGGFR